MGINKPSTENHMTIEPWALTVASVLIGGLAGHLLTFSRLKWLETSRQRAEREQFLLVKRADYASEFLAFAYTNLRYLMRDMIEEGGKRSADFAVLGRRIALFVSDECSQQIDTLTSTYSRTLGEIGGPHSVVEHSKYRDGVKRVAATLKAEIGGQ